MIPAMLEGLAASLSPSILLVMLIGVVVCQLIVIIPGLGGVFTLVVLLPFIYQMQPLAALAMLVAALAVTGTGNTITSIVLGVPGSSVGVATIFDGYPMARQGRAGEALGAGLMASAIGGIIGALSLALFIPILRPIVERVGPAEYFLLLLGAVLAVGALVKGAAAKGILAGVAGLMLATIGVEGGTAVARYTGGSFYLWDGIAVVPAIIGLFAIAEMLHLWRSGGAISQVLFMPKLRDVLAGGKQPFVYFGATLRSSITGSSVGILPGLGGEAGQFLAYAQASRWSKTPEKFGKGAVEGVIAADAATNANAGGSLVPTLGLGIPGSAPAAVLLAAFITLGIQPGPLLLSEGLSTVWLIIWVLVIANLMAVAFCMLLAPWLARITLVPIATLAPVIILVGLYGSYISSRRFGDVLVAIAFGFVGFVMRKLGFSRAAMVIGIVLGGILETNFLLALNLYGPAMFLRPYSLLIIAIVVLTVTGRYARSLVRMGTRRQPSSP